MATFYQSASFFVGGTQPYAPPRHWVPGASGSFTASLSDTAATSDGYTVPMNCACNSDVYTATLSFGAMLTNSAATSETLTASGGSIPPYVPHIAAAASATMQSILATWNKPPILSQLKDPPGAASTTPATSPYVPYKRTWVPIVNAAWQPQGIFHRV